MEKFLNVLKLIVKIITWLIANGIPFLRGIIEEIKAAREKRLNK